MRVDVNGFRDSTCTKCKNYTGDKPTFGKCQADTGKIYSCARMRMFENKNFEAHTGVKRNV